METVEEVLSLSSIQKGVLLHSVSSPEAADLYIVQLVAELKGSVKIDAFEQAWQFVFDRHATLRTVFFWEDFNDPL